MNIVGSWYHWAINVVMYDIPVSCDDDSYGVVLNGLIYAN